MITHSTPEVKSGPINRAILLPPAMPPPAASTSHHPASQCRPSGGEAIPPRQPMPAKAGEARTHPPVPHPRPMPPYGRRGQLRRISPPQRRNKSASYCNRAEFSRIPRFSAGLCLAENTSRAAKRRSPSPGLSGRAGGPPPLALKGRRGISSQPRPFGQPQNMGTTAPS